MNRTDRPRSARFVTRPNSFAAVLAAAAALLASATVLAVPPAVPGITTSRSGNDLVISWSAVGAPADGYRVYKATDTYCSSPAVVYSGTALSYTVAGAFLDTTPAMYGVAAYDATGEGPRTGPIYHTPVSIPGVIPDVANGVMLSFPPETGPTTSVQLCQDFNDFVSPPEKVSNLVKWQSSTATAITQTCFASKTAFSRTPAEGYLAKPIDSAPTFAHVWGVGEPAATDFVPISPDPWPFPACSTGLKMVSLPWDHDYPDLASIAAEIPEAVRVGRHNPMAVSTESCMDFEGAAYFVGLHRATPSDPWSGPNTALDPFRGEGVVIGVASPTSWTPRRRCTAFAGGGGGPINIPPVADPGGPYDHTACFGGLLGIWIDGTDSFDPDHTPPDTLSYHWSTTCSGTITDPDAALTTAAFDCDPCTESVCEVTLRVTDPLGATSTSTSSVLSRIHPGCFAGGTVLKACKRGGGGSSADLAFDWSPVGATAPSYVLLRYDDREQSSSPSYVSCGPELGHVAAPGTPDIEYFHVNGFDAVCPPR